MYLLDTHVVIWMLYDSNAIPEGIRQKMVEEPCCISVVSLWELAIKSSLNKIQLKQSINDISEICQEFGMKRIGVEPAYLWIMVFGDSPVFNLKIGNTLKFAGVVGD